jgi:ankyrin repeat protein
VPDIREHPDLISAIMADDLEAVEAMLETDPTLAARRGEQSPVLLAVYRHRFDVLHALLQRRPSLDVFEASAAGDIVAVRERIEAEPASVQAYAADGFTPLHLAAFFGHEEVARVLLDAGARIDAVTHNEMENMPLHAAAAGRHLDVCALLLERGAPVDAQQEGGFTALHAAAQHGDMALARLLVAHGAGLQVETDAGETPSELAFEFEHDDVSQYLRGEQ